MYKKETKDTLLNKPVPVPLRNFQITKLYADIYFARYLFALFDFPPIALNLLEFIKVIDDQIQQICF
jgi:hypothetical protein